jgi:hypothetical protein
MPQGDRFCGNSVALIEGAPEVAPIGAGAAAGAGVGAGATAVGAGAAEDGAAAAGGAVGVAGAVLSWAKPGRAHVISANSMAASVQRTRDRLIDAVGRATRRWSLCIMKNPSPSKPSSAAPHTIPAETVRQK